MRINIITQPLFSNYGGILQNYALQEVLRRMGHDPLTINVPVREINKRADWKAYIKTIRNLISKLRGNYAAPFLNPHTFAIKERELSFPQRRFVKKHIAKTDRAVPFNKALEREFPADLWIVGSDQVWRPWCSPNIGNYFFDFLSEGARRISYAASFGTDKWEISGELTPNVRDLTSRFEAITVREFSGVRLCKDFLGVEATHALDPTMLLTAQDYLALTSDEDSPAGGFIATYVLDASREKAKIIKAESRNKELPIVRVGAMRKNGFDSVESWLATLARARYVVTDSFHGTVFSIIFRRPVKVLSNGLRGNSRLESLFSMLGLESSPDGFIYPNDETDARLRALKQQSLDFLNKILSEHK